MSGEAATVPQDTTPMCLACGGRGYTVAYNAWGHGFVVGCVPCEGSGREGGTDPLKAYRQRAKAAKRA